MQASLLDSKKVCIVLRGVVDNRAIKAANALGAAGADVTILAFTYNRSNFDNGLFKVSYKDPVEAKPSTSTSRFLRILENVTAKRMHTAIREHKYGQLGQGLIKNALLEMRPDIIHAINADTIKGAALAAKEIGACLVYEAYEYWPEHALEKICNFSKTKQRFLIESEKEHEKNASLFITVSPCLAQLYQQTLLMRSKPEVILNAPVNYTAKARSSENPIRFLFLGNLQEDRNLKTLFEAAAGSKDINLTFQGEGRLKKYFSQEIAHRGLESAIEMRDSVPYEEVAQSCKDFDVGIMCSIPYNRQVDGALPNKFFEYLAGGLALACTRTSAIESFPEFEDFGTFVDSSSVDSLRRSLEEIARDVEGVTRMKKSAVAASSKYCGDVQAGKLVSFYSEMLGRAHR